MKLTRTTALVALLLAALAAPVAAFALDNGSSDDAAHPSSQIAKAKKDKDHPGHATGRERADEASAAGRAHAEAMKAWAACVAKAASGPKADEHTGPPKDACGDKPPGPGRAKHASGGPQSSTPPGKSKDHQRGKSETHKSH